MNFMKALFGGTKTDLSPIMAQDPLILDVRNPGEFAGGHVKNALNIPVHEIGAHIQKIKKYNKPVIAYCRSGARSGSAVSILESHGITAFNGGSKGEMEHLAAIAEQK